MGRVRAEYWAIFWLVYVHLLFFRHSGPLLCPLEKSVGFFKPGTFLSTHIRTQPRSRGVRGRWCVLGWCVLHCKGAFSRPAGGVFIRQLARRPPPSPPQSRGASPGSGAVPGPAWRIPGSKTQRQGSALGPDRDYRTPLRSFAISAAPPSPLAPPGKCSR